MVNRRGALKIGAATLAGVFVKRPDSGPYRSPTQPDLAFHRAIFDQRFAESQVFAAELHKAGVVTSAIRGDVAELWYDDLRRHLRENNSPITGLTDRAALFCLEELARDVGMKVVFRVDRVIEKGQDADHAQEIGRTMAQMISHFDSNAPRDASAQKRTGPFSPENKTALVSWVIA